MLGYTLKHSLTIVTDKCGGLNTAVGKVYRKVDRKPHDMDGTETDFLEILTKHEVYNVCYCRGFSCDPGNVLQFE